MQEKFTIADYQQSLLDPSQIISRDQARWNIGADAVPIEANPTTPTSLYPASLKIERASVLPQEFDVVIGGLCSIFTGDLPIRSNSAAVSLLRMDQIVESVGIVTDKPAFIVIEDSLWANLTGLPLTQLQLQAQEAARRITSWVKLASPASDLIVVNTSTASVETGLQDAVGYLANDILKNPQFARLQAAPILMMYTSYWAELLASLGFLSSDKAVCIEPVIHFIDSRKFPDLQLQKAYREFIQWLKDNPYGISKSRNANFGIAGFLESLSGDQTKKRTRLLPYTQVPNTQNYQDWNRKLIRGQSIFPFPLRNSLLFTEAVNWGLWQPTIRETLLALIELERQYYQVKAEIPQEQKSRESAEKIKAAFYQQVQPYLKILAGETINILAAVLGD